MRDLSRLMPTSDRPKAVAWALAVLLLLAWWRVVANGFVWDDDDYVFDNPLLRDGAGLFRIWFEPHALPQYYPLVHSSFWLEYRLWGASPLGYHVVNVLLHGAAAWAGFRLLQRLAVPGAAFVALWFAVHPLQVESVAWVTERKNVLSLLLALWAAWRWLAWYDGSRGRDLVWGSCQFGLALLAKTVVATVPAALLVVVWWRDGRLPARAWRGATPWLLLGAAAGLTTAYLEATHVGARGTVWQLVGAERLVVAGRAVWHYATSLIWPFGLCFNYPRWDVRHASLWAFMPAVLTVLAVVVACLWRRRSRTPLAVVLLFVGMLSPALGFFDVYPFRYSYVADHFAYHASLAGLAGITAALLPVVGRVAPWLGAVVLLLSAGVCFRTLPDYRNFETLFRSVLRRNPDSALALANLGAVANLRGDSATARELLERCLAVDASNHEAMVNLGVIAHRAGDRGTARSWYERARHTAPHDVHAANNLAVLLIEDGEAAAALPLVQAALAAVPDFLAARATLAWALCTLQRWQEALPELDFVLQRQPADLLSRERAVRCLMALGCDRPAAANALIWLRQAPADAAARQQVLVALARVLRAGDAAGAGNDAVAICRNAGVDAMPLLADLAAELDRTGALPHARAVRAAVAPR